MRKLISATLLVLLAAVSHASARDGARIERETHAQAPVVLDLASFGAVGDGVSDDGPALQQALDALAGAGGGTLNVAAGRYAISTPVNKDFSGGAVSIRLQGVASETFVNPWGTGEEVTSGLGLVSEFVIQTGLDADAITLSGLDGLVISDLVFIGRQEAEADARVTLVIYDVKDAVIHHSEFYGLSTYGPGGAAILHADRSRLTIEQTVFLGCAADSSVNMPVVLNTNWKSFTITDSAFADYGQRPDYFGKLGQGTPISWVMIGNPAPPEPLSPRREAVFNNVFMDEGALIGIMSHPDWYDPQAQSSDLIYISRLKMNVSSAGGAGVGIYRASRVFIEGAEFGLSTSATAAVDLWDAGDVILDRLLCGAAAERIHADQSTGSLTIIDSIYNQLDSQAQTTRVITTTSPDEDPVQDVRAQFLAAAGRAPDPAAHFYWPERLLVCADDAACVSSVRLALSSYLAAQPTPVFSVAGTVTDENGALLPGVTVTLGGSQQVSTVTGADGAYIFSGLPTSGDYTLTPALQHYTFGPASFDLNAPTSDSSADFTGTIERFYIGGQISDPAGVGLAGVFVILSGPYSATTTTDATGVYAFYGVPAGGDYTVTPVKDDYVFIPAAKTFDDLDDDRNADFAGTSLRFYISGRVYNANNNGMQGVFVTLSGSQTGTATTDASGVFTFADLPGGGNFTVTPSLPEYTLSPASRTFNGLAANQHAEFAATPISLYSISGRVTEAGGGLAGVSITLSGSQSAATTTDASGNYVFANLPAGGNYIVTPSLADHTFTPAFRSYDNLAGDQSAQDFTTASSSSTTSDIVWFDDSLPGGAQPYANGETWNWVTANPTPYSGTSAHQSAVAAGVHNHFFLSATEQLTLAAGDKLFTYVFIDPANVPTELMLQWFDGANWYNAYWGADNITQVSPRLRVGDLPAAGQWVRLEVPAASLGLEGKSLSGMSFVLAGGRATWDKAGKATTQVTPPTGSERVWVEDTIPAGGIPDGSEPWTWVTSNPTPHSGTQAHQSLLAAGIHHHYFRAATSTLQVNTGERLFAYVYLDPTNLPSELMLQWHDGTQWRNAYWGSDLIPQVGERVHMGALPAAGEWVRLEVPASALGLEGKTLTGMSYVLHGGRATWDRAGALTTGQTSGDVVWVEDAIPAGGVPAGSEPWTWASTNPAPFSGTQHHRSPTAAGIHHHYFQSATATLSVGSGEKLFAYIYLDAASPPAEVMLQWFDGTQWRNAYWGADLIPQVGERFNAGVLPAAGQWVRLEVPAASVGLENRTLSGMSFVLHGGGAAWDKAGKSP